MKKFALFSFLLFTFYSLLNPARLQAIYDPLSVPNNRYGIHIIQATPHESSPAADLVNSSGGDWGYITVLVESKDRNHDKWQEFFDDLRKRHLIPLVRLATQPEGDFWKLPYEGEEQAWADFLDALNWPTKNRYIIIYNEPNHATEWGNKVDAKSYAEILDKTITALKNKNPDFFVLNAGMDASAPSRYPKYEDQKVFMKQMDEAIPGIFNKLDGWVSHSYPNPEFSGSPDATGRGTVRTWVWEIQELRSLGVNKLLPIFITETGWKHAEGLNYSPRFASAEKVSSYYKQSLENAWNSSRIVAVSPFLLNYQEPPFDHFSFKKPLEEGFYSMFETIKNLVKTSGRPIQENMAELVNGEIYSSIVAGETYQISLTFKNVGQSIWNERVPVKLVALEGGSNLGILPIFLPKQTKVEPGKEYTFNLNIKAPSAGIYPISFNLFMGEKEFISNPVKFTTTVKDPVVLKIISGLGWRNSFEGNYILKVKGINGESAQGIELNRAGISENIEIKHLLPDYMYEFSLQKPFYKTKLINKKVYTGINTLDFGTLQPDLVSVFLHPIEFLKQQPFSP